MRYSISLIIACFLFTCNEAPKTTASDAPETTVTAAPKISGSAAPAQKPPTDMQETTMLASKIWVFEHWIDTEVPERDQDQIGRWYRFAEDGTFVGGHWENQNDEGTWFLKEGSPHNLLLIDSAVDDNKDGEWEIQKITFAQDSFTGVKTKNRGDGRPVIGQLSVMPNIPMKAESGF